MAGNRVEVLEVGADEARKKLRGTSELWKNICRDALVIYGRSIDQLRELVNA